MKPVLADLRIFSYLSVTCLILILLDSFGLLNLLKSGIQFITSPIQYGVYKTGTGFVDQFSFIFTARSAVQENQALKKQLEIVISDKALLQKQLNEAKAIQDQSSSLGFEVFDLKPAKILSSGRYINIDKGSDDGVKVGSVVIFKDNYIGQVKSTSSKTSQVILLSDPDSKIAVFSQNQNGRARGILQGQFGSESLMDKILHQENISIGDIVYSEGTEGQLPRGLILGIVTQVNERENEVFKTAKIKPIIEPQYLDIVFVLNLP